MQTWKPQSGTKKVRIGFPYSGALFVILPVFNIYQKQDMENLKNEQSSMNEPV